KRLSSECESEVLHDPGLEADALELEDGANPTRSWQGNQAVQSELAKLWPKYQQVRRKRNVVFHAFSIARCGSNEFGFGVSQLGDPLNGWDASSKHHALWSCYQLVEHADVYIVRYPVHTYHVAATN